MPQTYSRIFAENQVHFVPSVAGGSSRSSTRSWDPTSAPPRNSTAVKDSRPRAKTTALQAVSGKEGPKAGKNKAGGIILGREESKQIFKEIDANGNGEISQIEYIKALRKDKTLADRLGLPCEIKQEDESRRVFQYMYGEMDKDDSKSINLEEFVAYYTDQDIAQHTNVLAIEDTSLQDTPQNGIPE